MEDSSSGSTLFKLYPLTDEAAMAIDKFHENGAWKDLSGKKLTFGFHNLPKEWYVPLLQIFSHLLPVCSQMTATLRGADPCHSCGRGLCLRSPLCSGNMPFKCITDA